MSLVERIQGLCSKNNTTLIGLEREIGLGRGTIRNWDTNSPSIDKVQKVADFFDVSIDEILDRPYNPAFDTFQYELYSALSDLLGTTYISGSRFIPQVEQLIAQESEDIRKENNIEFEYTPDAIIELCKGAEFYQFILDIIKMLIRVKIKTGDPVNQTRNNITLAAHKTDGYNDDLTVEEQRAVKAFIETYRKQFKKDEE